MLTGGSDAGGLSGDSAGVQLEMDKRAETIILHNIEWHVVRD